MLRRPFGWSTLLTKGVPFEEVGPSTKGNRFTIEILGEGGIGKTSLLCQFALSCFSTVADSRLMTHRALPVLIQGIPDGDQSPADSSASFLLDIVRDTLSSFLASEEPVSGQFVERLLRARRVIVFIDGYSEFGKIERRRLGLEAGGIAGRLINGLVISSRVQTSLPFGPGVVCHPTRIRGDRLSSFMHEYLQARGARDLFPDSEYFGACQRLTLLVGRSAVTVLLAKMYAEQMISLAENRVSKNTGEEPPINLQDASQDAPEMLDALPKSIPELMLGYLNELNARRPEGAPDDRTVQRAAMAVAWTCVSETFQAGVASRQAAIDEIADPNASLLLDDLENRLRVIQSVGVRRANIRFLLDPLAEYLAASHWFDRYGQNPLEWTKLFAQMDARSDQVDPYAFLTALNDVSTSTGFLAKHCEIERNLSGRLEAARRVRGGESGIAIVDLGRSETGEEQGDDSQSSRNSAGPVA